MSQEQDNEREGKRSSQAHLETGSAVSRRAFLEHSFLLSTAGLLNSNALASSSRSRSEERRSGWQLGCYTRLWDQYDYRVALDGIAEAGYEYAGLMSTKRTEENRGLIISVNTSPEEAVLVGEEVTKRGMQIPSLYGGGIPVKESLQAGIQGLRRLIDNSVACGAKNLMMAGAGPDRELSERYNKAIAECCDYAEAKGVGISLKPHGGLVATGPQCRAVVESVNHPNFRIWYDPGNIFFYSDGQLDPVEDAAAVKGLVVGMSIKDYEHPKNVWVTPGHGQVNFAVVLGLLRQGGFTKGPLVVECVKRGNAQETIEEARETRLFLEELIG